MAHYCPDCRQIFERHGANCPLCGFYMVDDDKPDQVYLDMGYSRYVDPRKPGPTAASASPASRIREEDEDLIDQLRSGFRAGEGAETAGTDSRPAEATPTQETQEDFFGSYRTGTEQPQPRVTQPAQQSRPDGTQPEDFFGSYGTERPQTHTQESIPQEETPKPESPRSNDYRVRGIGGNNARRFFQGAGDAFRAVPWRALLIIALIVIVCVALYSLWQMRGVIISSILSFVTGLIPAALVIAGIVWLFRSLFR